jgi:lipid II:glycine glycyltransferase (peptidoglycan interpeptide bridge formation enzyme)
MSLATCDKTLAVRETPTAVSDYKFQISGENQDTTWDQFVANVPAGHHVQTSLWGQVKAALGWCTERIIVTHQENIVAGVQVLYRRITLIGGISYVPAGPLLQYDDPDLMQLLLYKLLEFSRNHHLHYIVIQPPDESGEIMSQLSSLGFEPSSVELKPTASVLIDLTLDLSDILAQMKRQTRQNITRGERQGIVVREGKKEDLHTFCSLNEATCQRQDALHFPEMYFTKMWDVLEPAGHLKLFLAEYNGEAVSSLMTIPYGQTVSAKALGWSGLCPDRRPNEALFWTAIKWSKSHGYRWFDFEGVDRTGAECVTSGQPLPERLRKTPDFFKYGFGGQVVLYPRAHEYIRNPILRWGYGKLFSKDGDKTCFLKLFDFIRKR